MHNIDRCTDNLRGLQRAFEFDKWIYLAQLLYRLSGVVTMLVPDVPFQVVSPCRPMTSAEGMLASFKGTAEPQDLCKHLRMHFAHVAIEVVLELKPPSAGAHIAFVGAVMLLAMFAKRI